MNELAIIRHKECEETLNRSIGSMDRLNVAIEFLKFIVGVGAAVAVVHLQSLIFTNMWLTRLISRLIPMRGLVLV